MDQLLVSFHDHAPPPESFLAAMQSAFGTPDKAIPCQYLYDARGSALFEEICKQPEYYVTRVETGILRRRAPEIAAHIGPSAQIVELGSGASRKIKVLLERLQHPREYVSVDVSRRQLLHTARDIARMHPALPVTAVCADYWSSPWMRALNGKGQGRRVAFFPGSSIGNLKPRQAVALLRHIRRLVGRGGGFLLGVDLKKDRSLLDAAYNDRAGVTAAFTLNLVSRINRELNARIDPASFRHKAFYNEREGRMEIYLESLRRQRVRLGAEEFDVRADERIHAEYSYKYTVAEVHALARAAGFQRVQDWTDPEGFFLVSYLQAS